jgi:hypothetical protein
MRTALDRITLADLARTGGDPSELLRRRLASVVVDEPTIPLPVLK